MTVFSKQLLGPHRYNDKWGDIKISGLPQDLNVPSLYINEANIHYDDHSGKKCIFYEKQKDRPGQTYGLEKTRKWSIKHEGNQITLIIYHLGEYTTSVLRPIAFNGTYIILQQ